MSERLAARNLINCFHDKSTTEEEEDTEGSEFNPGMMRKSQSLHARELVWQLRGSFSSASPPS